MSSSRITLGAVLTLVSSPYGPDFNSDGQGQYYAMERNHERLVVAPRL